ncbi:MAG: hypothetical protein KF784_06700 [Fimbriimonadaceae bacterium]|nr:hypothetical protein [Fimbriimonadaceae bacterium]
MIKAVLDVGSNSVLLTVMEHTTAGWRPICETSEVTALGEGTKKSGVLSEPAMQRTLAAIKRGWEKASELGAESIVVAATMAARIATNAPEFLSRGQAQGTPIKVLSGDEEAELGFLAVANDPLFKDAQRISIIDPGGHSTELVTADRVAGGWETGFRRSYPVGTLAMLSGVFSEECPDGLAQMRASKEIDETIGLCYLPHQHGTVVTLGATGTNLITIRERMPEWNPEKVHGARLDYEEISRAVSWLSEMPISEREEIVGMEPGREKTLHAGALILERFLFAVRAESCFVSVRGWRHAMIEG